MEEITLLEDALSQLDELFLLVVVGEFNSGTEVYHVCVWYHLCVSCVSCVYGIMCVCHVYHVYHVYHVCVVSFVCVMCVCITSSLSLSHTHSLTLSHTHTLTLSPTHSQGRAASSIVY